MARNVNTTFAAHAALPFALILVLALAQGGSCGKKAAGTNAAKASNTAAATASNAAANAAATPAGAQASGRVAVAANSNAGGAGKDNSAVEKLSEAGGVGDVAAGMWGGQHVRLEVKGDGAEIEFDCAHGRIDGRLRPGIDGRFDATGTFVAERGGPVRLGAPEKSEPARYTGHVKDKTMTLTVRLTNSDTDAGTFTLTHGREPELTKCL